ncbi:MAG: hypothetical protein KC996_06945 [Phycisphaerales bacterium]|nr:hypothetical protein [Phycisphaerales bacterium]
MLKAVGFISAIVMGSASAHAQYSIRWSTVDAGGGTHSGPSYAVCGSFHQFGAVSAPGSVYAVDAGFWGGAFASDQGCGRADFTGDQVLDVFDVFAFLDAFNNAQVAADFTGDGLFDVFDVFGFLGEFNQGCL